MQMALMNQQNQEGKDEAVINEASPDQEEGESQGQFQVQPNGMPEESNINA